MIIIGIDPGVVNGYSLYDTKEGKLCVVTSGKTWQIITWLKIQQELSSEIIVYIEDPTTWRPFKGSKDQSHRLKAAGSVTARFRAILEYLEDNSINFVRVPIQGNAKKMSSDMFVKVTGWDGRTNEHGRDAALLIYGKKNIL
jgi:hypothetical protein